MLCYKDMSFCSASYKEAEKPFIAYIDAHPKFVQDIGAVANEMKNIERKQQGRIYRPRILKELFSE